MACDQELSVGKLGSLANGSITGYDSVADIL